MPFVFAGLAILGAVISTLATSPAARRLLATAIAHAVFWAQWIIQHLAPEIAAEMAATIAVAMEATRPSLLAAAAVMLEELTGQKIDVPTLFDARVGPYLGGSSVGAFDKVAGGIANVIAPPGDMRPETGLTNLTGLFSLHLGTSLQAWGIDLLADMLSLGKLRSVAQFHAAIDAGLGFRRLGMLMWRAPIEEAITKPLRRYYGELYNFSIPDATQAITGWYQGVYTDDEMLSLLGSAGYSHQRATELLNIEQRHLTPLEAEEAWRTGLVDDLAWAPILRADKLGDDRAAIVAQLITNRKKEQELASIATTARDLYRAGDLDEDTYRQYLEAAHWRDEEISLALTADQLAVRKEKQLSSSEILTAYEAQHLSAVDARARLRRQHYDDADIDLLMAGKRKQLSPAQLISLVGAGKMTADDATVKLTAFGYSTGDAAALLDLHTKRLSEGQVLDALRQSLITLDTARQDLETLGYPEDQADLLLAFTAKQLSPADVQAALLRGILGETDALEHLQRAGYSRADAEAIVQLRVRLLSEGQIIDAYGAGQIPRGTALGDLEARGLAQQDAGTIVAMFDRKAQLAAARAAQKAAEAEVRAELKAQSSGQPPQTP